MIGGLEPSPPAVDPSEVLGALPSSESKSVREYRQLIKESLAQELPGLPRAIESQRHGSLYPAYTIDPGLNDDISKLIGRFAPDYSALAAIDATTGRVLALVSYAKRNDVSHHLALKASFPAASIFKIVTAAAAIEGGKMAPDTVIPFNGASHTLYKRQVEQTRHDRWTRYMSLRDAFAKSINTVFGKVGAFYAGPERLNGVADRFGFNQALESDLPFEAGVARLPADASNFEIAEIASGFNRDSTLSVLHGAMVGAAIAADGLVMRPFVVDTLRDVEGEAVYQAEPEAVARALKPADAAQLRTLMQATIDAGTSRKSFREVRRWLRDHNLEFGGKTGSLTGGEPRGKCDWFVGYMRHAGPPIAVAVLTVNPDKWTVKSSYLAARFFDFYLKRHTEGLRLVSDQSPRRTSDL